MTGYFGRLAQKGAFMKYILYYETNTCLTCRHFGDLYDCILYILLEFKPNEEKLEKIKIVAVDN